MSYDPRYSGPDRSAERAEYEAWSAEIARQADAEQMAEDALIAQMEDEYFLAEVAQMVFVPGLGWS